jgi:hypothetical protein
MEKTVTEIAFMTDTSRANIQDKIERKTLAKFLKLAKEQLKVAKIGKMYIIGLPDDYIYQRKEIKR